MRVVFICGSLEPGRDGVGDYTQRLAEEFVKRGHEVLIVALNDKYIKTQVEDSENVNPNKLRIPSFAIKEGRDSASRKILSFDPHWVSLQYVPFSFQKRGLPYKLKKFVSDVAQGRKVHVMFHELWVGMDRESNCQHKIWGWMQMMIVKNLINDFKPNLINTSNQLYQAMLASISIETEKLKLFGNIPLIATDLHTIEPSDIRLVMFGGIHHGAPIEAFAQEVAVFAKENKLKISLAFIGRCGAEQDKWVKVWKAEGLQVNILGEQPESVISELLLNSTAGISTTPILLIEKSGSVAAMLEHGLPVLCVARKWQPAKEQNWLTPQGVIEYKVDNFGDLITQKIELCKDGVYNTADQLLTKMLI